MEQLYIKIVDGIPVDHPVLEQTLQDAFGGIPIEYSKFLRYAAPNVSPGKDKKYVVSYQKSGKYWMDTFTSVDMTAEEITERDTRLAEHDAWLAANNLPPRIPTVNGKPISNDNAGSKPDIIG